MKVPPGGAEGRGWPPVVPWLQTHLSPPLRQSHGILPACLFVSKQTCRENMRGPFYKDTVMEQGPPHDLDLTCSLAKTLFPEKATFTLPGIGVGRQLTPA